jgi:transketolase
MNPIDRHWSEEDEVAISFSRHLALEILERAGSGHPGATLSLMPLLYVLYTRVLEHNPEVPTHSDRDRVILSCGHACLAQYIQLHFSGYGISKQDLLAFRTLGSNTPGHPELHTTPGIELSTGPLGQGFAMSVGVALSQQMRAKNEDRKLAKTYVVMSDGDMQEGITHEAANLAAYYKLENLIAIYDSNDITIDGDPCISRNNSTELIYKGLGWNVEYIDKKSSGEINVEALLEHLENKASDSRPTLYIMKSVIGWPAPNWRGTPQVHGNLLPTEELEATKLALNLPSESHTEIEAKVRKHYSAQTAKLKINLLNLNNNPIRNVSNKNLSELTFPTKISTRKANSEIINLLRQSGISLFGGSADLTESNSLSLDLQYQAENISPLHQNLRFGVREHAMSAIVNGLATNPSMRAFCATYLVFSDYQRPAIRMAALMGLPALYLWTHDSIAIGPDGPTHQPIEQIASLRTIPNFDVIRPGSADELRHIWERLLQNPRPTGLILSRQDLLNDVDRQTVSSKAIKGAYTYFENFRNGQPELIVIATGSELELAYEAIKTIELSTFKIRLVSMPCQSWFRKESLDYQEEVLPTKIQKRISIEAGTEIGWHEFVPQGKRISIETYGSSGSGEDLLKHFGFTKENVINEIHEILSSSEK